MGIWSGITNRAKVLFDARYRHMYSQRLITDMPKREAAARKIASTLPSYTDSATGKETFKLLTKDGYAPLPELVSQKQVSEMRAYFDTKKTTNPYNLGAGSFSAPSGVPVGTHVAYFNHEDVVNAPHFLRIANDPSIISAISSEFGAKPTISYMAAWWSIAHGEAAQHAELFHRDVDDLHFIKLFLYLTDVDEESGPHVFVRGSHKVNALTEIRRLSEEEVAKVFGASNILLFKGPAGTAFLENTYGIHRGVPPTRRPRLLLQVLYSLTPYVGGPARPVAAYRESVDGISLDKYINRIYLK